MSIFRQWFKPPEAGSGNVAKDRLRLVLVHNRLNVSAETIDNLKHDMLQVLARYFDVDQDSFALDVQRGQRSSQLVTTISVKRKKKGV
jgi:cell division topological specificity factor